MAEPVIDDPDTVAGPDTVAAPNTVASPDVVIEIDPSMSGGYVYGRFDVMIRGRAMSASAIGEIRLQVDGLVSGIASFGQPERAAAAIMPDGTPARQRGFQFNLPRPGDGRTETCAFQIIARTEDGFEYAETFALDIDPTAGDPVSVSAGPTRGISTGGRPHAVIYIERGTIDADGMLSVEGWAVSLGQTLAVQIYADDERISKAKIGGERDDVAGALPAYPNAGLSGFSLTLQLDEVDRDAGRIRAQVVCANGFGHEESIPVERVQRRSAPRPQRAPNQPAAVPDRVQQQGFSLFNEPPAYQLSADFRIADEPL
ncbi:MAG: hypothetical protein QOF70_1680, partial [Acetobacteraceae bacterium]|nr:hypothetical protein [Acetobacteraceae bacterium]